MKSQIRRFIIAAVFSLAIFIVLKAFFSMGLINNYYQGIVMILCVNVILATSLNLTTGFLGQLALGHAGFMSVGAYAAALCTLELKLPFVLSLAAGGVVAAIFGILIGIPALRLRGDYLAIITLGFGEIIRVIILNLNITGGARGLKGIPMLTTFNYAFWVMIITLAVLFLLIRSRHGRAIVSIREDEIAAESSGIDTTFYKLFAFTISAFFAGVAGGLYAHYITILNASKFNFNYSVEILVIVVLGGMGNLWGSIVSAILLTILPEALRGFASWRMIIYSLLLIVVMVFRGSGLSEQFRARVSGALSRPKADAGKRG